MGQVELPQRIAADIHLIAAPGVRHEQVESALLTAYSVEELAYLVGVGVVDRDRNALAARRGDLVGGVLDRLGPAGRTAAGAGRSTGPATGRSMAAEDSGDATATAATRPGDDGDLLS